MNTNFPRIEAPAFDSLHFRQVLGQFVTGVAIVTTRLADGSFRGLTISSFNSVSLEPPLVLWSLRTAASSMPIFSGNSHYVVNILSDGQQELARLFSRPDSDPFSAAGYRLSRTGQPMLDGCVAWFECHNRRRYIEGDHAIFVGEVEDCGLAPKAPLVYHGGQFGNIKTGWFSETGTYSRHIR